jgi:hypothetical protein
LGLDDLAGGECRGADAADLPLVNEVGECPQGFFGVGVGSRTVYLVEVDPIGIEGAQRILDGADDPAPRHHSHPVSDRIRARSPGDHVGDHRTAP